MLRRGLVLGLFFASGFAGLVYQVLWMKDLGLLFGNTAQAAATTLAAFFLGLVVGARSWGRRAERSRRPLRTYAYLEAGVAISAALYFLLLDLYHAVYPVLFQLFGEQRLPFLAVKFVLAMGLLFPASFCMGGTLPMMSQYLIRRRTAFGRTASMLYAVNTVGAACGAYVAGFHLPRALGFDRSYAAAMVLTGIVAGLAWILGREAVPTGDWYEDDTGAGERHVPWSRRTVWTLAAFSGFATLGLEVLWTRMFAQALQNSVYTFSVILVTFLLALALGATVANRLIRSALDPAVVLPVLLLASGLLVASTPFVFVWMTDGLQYFGGQRDFVAYVVATFLFAFCVILLPAILLGVLFPYLFRLAQPLAHGAGRSLGDLSAVNMLGAVVGSLSAGFVLLELFGLWASIRLVTVAYLGASLLLASRFETSRGLERTAPLGALLLVVTILDPSRLPIVHVDPVDQGESVLRVWEGSSGIVSVIRQPASLTIKLDNDYSLGGTGAAKYEEGQTHLPLWLHPDPRSVFFLGMGTGITAGAALLHPVERVVVSELSADVVAAARTFFRPYLHGLFEDPRVAIVAEDGRNVLFGTSESFDVIVADLFMTWKAGVGNLYSLEHYRAAREHLRSRGIYAQWLPLYQLSRREMCVIARTMVEVFPRVTLWRGAIAPGWETAVLIGHRDADALDRRATVRRLRQSGDAFAGSTSTDANQSFSLPDLLIQYAGDLTAATEVLAPCPLNTDDRPVIEYEAPVTHRRARAGAGGWFVGAELARFLGEIFAAVPPEEDPYLAELATAERQAVRGGLSLYASQVLDRAGDQKAARRALRDFETRYAAAGQTSSAEAASERNRHEIEQLIAGYEERIRGLRRHLPELDGETAFGPGEIETPPSTPD